MQNYHKHTSYSNVLVSDCACAYEEYIKRAKELGQNVISSVEHGYQSNYYVPYELVEKSNSELKKRLDDGLITEEEYKKQKLKFVFGAEAYWVKDRKAEHQSRDKKTGELAFNKDGSPKMVKDRSNCHIVLLAKNEEGRRDINEALSDANIDGYYGQPRLDLELIFRIKPENVFVTSACFLKGTNVLTIDGYKKIENIRKDDFVVNRYGKLEKVNFPTKINYDGLGYEFTSNAFPNTFSCTADHKFLVTSMTDLYNKKSPEWETAENIYKRNSLSNHERKLFLYPVNTDFNNKNIIHKKDFDGVYKKVTQEWSVKQKINGDVVITPELMRLFGYFIGDGHISVFTKNDRIGFSFNENEFEYYYSDFIMPVERQLGIRFCKSEIKKSHKVELSSSSIDLINLFYYLFGNCKADNKYIPRRLLHISYELDCELLYGMILSDGCIVDVDNNTSKRMIYATISEQLMMDFNSLCCDLGIYCTHHFMSAHIDKNNIKHRKSYYMYFHSKNLRNIEKRKYNTHENVVETFKKLYENCHRKPRRIIDGQEYLVLKISNIKEIKINEDVYCLNNESHSFISEFAIAHNCLAFWKYDDIEEIVVKMHQHFGENFFLEVQCHNTNEQRELNQRILNLSEKYGIDIIFGYDSHYILEEDAIQRENYIATRRKNYVKEEDEETGWYMDYCTEEEVRRRLREQDVLNEEQIDRCIRNTDLILDFDDIVFDKEIKLPDSCKGEDESFKNEKLKKLVYSAWEDEKKHVPEERWKEYEEGIEYELNAIIETHMADYFLLDYEIVKRGVEKGGVITKTGRGSGVSYYVNSLLGFSNIDRFISPVKLYPDRFMSKTRILKTRSLPD